VVLHALPDLNPVAELMTRLPVHCADLDSGGSRLALGCGDGRVYFLALEGTETAPLVITPTRTSRRTVSGLQRLFGGSTTTYVYTCTCPACRRSFEAPQAPPGLVLACQHCRRPLRAGSVRVVEQQERIPVRGAR
jgi:hypothetical protein